MKVGTDWKNFQKDLECSCTWGTNLDKWRKKERCAQITNPYSTSILSFLNKKKSNFIPGNYVLI